MDSPALLSVRNLEVSYGAIKAVRGVSFEVPAGTVSALIGANGAGKTTVLRAISGLLKYGGEITFAGLSLRGRAPDRITASGVSHVPEGRGIFANLTVGENLRLATWGQRGGKKTIWSLGQVFELFPRLKERLGQAAGTLSGGEQQMLALARALMSQATLLLLDEPSMGLAPVLVREVFDIIKKVNSRGVTVLLVEQNAQMALHLASHALVLETGELVLSGPSAQLLGDKRVQAAYLGQ